MHMCMCFSIINGVKSALLASGVHECLLKKDQQKHFSTMAVDTCQVRSVPYFHHVCID